MPGVTFRASITRNLIPGYRKRVALGLRQAVETTLIEIEQDVKGGPHAAPIRTGNLRRSYHHQLDGPLSGTVGNDPSIAHYAVFVELGTVHMSAQPHLVPAAEVQREPFERRVRAALAAGGVT